MISSERLIITPHDESLSRVGQIQLAPFTADELRPYVPFPEVYKRHNPVRPEEDKLTPEELGPLPSGHAKNDHYL